MNTKTSTPVYFRKLEEADIKKLELFDTTEKAKIAECLNVTIDHNPFDVYIIADKMMDMSNQGNLTFICKSKDKKLSGDFGFVFMGNRNFTMLQQLARELMNVNVLSVVTFESNHFDMFYL